MSDKREPVRPAQEAAVAEDDGRRGVIDRGMEGIRAGAERLRDGAHAAAGRAGEVFSSARERIEEVSDKSLEELTGDLRRVVKRHPGKAVAVSLLVGFALGSLLSRRRD